MLRQTWAWLRRSRHRRMLRQALGASGAVDPWAAQALKTLAERQFNRWRGGRLPSTADFAAALRRLHDEHPSIHVFDIDGRRVLPRRKTGRAACHLVAALDARMYAKRVNHYGTLLAEVMARRGGRDRFSLAIDLRDIPHDETSIPVFSFQRLAGGAHPLLPDVDFFHHGWYLDDHDPIAYDDKSITACFVGASTGQPLSAEDVRHHRSQRLALAAAFQGSARVHFRIASAVHCLDAEAETLLRSQPYFSNPVSWSDQLQHRFLVSVDGNGATCSRVVKALRSQGVLVKFESEYQLYYFDLLEPGVHYVLARTAADVDRVLDLEQANPGHHRAMSEAATAFARRLLTAPAVMEYTNSLIDGYVALLRGR